MKVKNYGISHIAFILDGNGRWAKKRGKERLFGHKAGLISAQNTINSCIEFGIKYVTMYCFSTENWKREKNEVEGIFKIIEDFIDTKLDVCIEKGVRIRILGDKSKFSESMQNRLDLIETKTVNCDVINVNLCLNYGARDEIVRAINLIISNKLDKIDYSDLSSYLFTSDLPDPDFIVRTSGEQRLSNFLLLQSAYSELYFPKVFWPDFNKRWLKKCLKEYSKRHRRFGKA